MAEQNGPSILKHPLDGSDGDSHANVSIKGSELQFTKASVLESTQHPFENLYQSDRWMDSGPTFLSVQPIPKPVYLWNDITNEFHDACKGKL